MAYARPRSSASPRPSPVCTCAPESARDFSTAAARALLSAPSSASTAMASALPGCPASAGASASANQAVALPSAAAPAGAVSPAPALASPDTRKSVRPTAVSSATVSPTSAFAVRAAAASSTTSPSRGAAPADSAVPVKACEPQPWPASAPSPCLTGKVKSGTAASTPGAREAFAASPTSTRAVSGSGYTVSSGPSMLSATSRTDWSAATTTGAFAYRSAGTEARAPVSSRMPQAATISADIISATNVPANEAGLKRTAARARPFGVKILMLRPLPSRPYGGQASSSAPRSAPPNRAPGRRRRCPRRGTARCRPRRPRSGRA